MRIVDRVLDRIFPSRLGRAEAEARREDRCREVEKTQEQFRTAREHVMTQTIRMDITDPALKKAIEAADEDVDGG